MIPLTYVLCKAKVRYTMGGGEKINDLLFMDELKLHGKSENEIKTFVSVVEVFSHDIDLELRSVVWLLWIEERLSQQTG